MAAFVDRRPSSSFPSPDTSPPPNSHPLSSSSDDDGDDDEDDDYLDQLKNTMPSPSSPDPRDSHTPDGWIPRHPSLIRLTGKHPFNSEPPLSLLMSHSFLTPVPIHYVRNHGPVPQTAWSTWSIDVSGLVRRPARLSLDSLVRDFPSFQIPVTLVCAGNRRKEQNMVRQTVGFNWGPAAISTSLWRGVRLRHVLRRCGVMRTRDGALNVCFEGAEDLPGGKYGTSLSMEAAMDPSSDIMIAYMQNGEVLKPDHGFPVRMIIPGFIGGRMVKWLKRIIVTTKESESYYHYRDNRVLPSHVDAELADSQGWWYKPEYIINELNINSVITSPGHDEILEMNSADAPAVFYTLRGYAYSGGGKKVTRVEISLDGGETWQISALKCPERPNKYGKYWCWCFWSLEIDPLLLLTAESIAVRAWDQTLNTQPESLTWNVMGMMNNCWFRVRVAVCRLPNSVIRFSFEHPTQPGNDPGGWMSLRHRKENPKPSSEHIKKPVSVNSSTDARFSLSDLRSHSSPNSAWIAVHGQVFDCTAFLKDHPGGVDSILINAGSDCTEEFDAIHSDKAKSMLETYLIGQLILTPDASALKNPRQKKIPVTLLAKTSITRSLRLFRFALPSPDQVLDLPTGKHIFLSAVIDNKLCMRAYTPTSPEDAAGYFELLVRIYFKGEDPGFPAGGLMTQHLDSLPLGAAGLEIKAPVGHIEYAGKGSFVVEGKEVMRARRVAMVAGGTGITPVYQVIRAVMREEEGVETMHLVYASRSENEMLLREELDEWARERPERFRVWYVVSRVTEGVLREHIPMGGGDKGSLALVCGPPAMVKGVVLPTLETMGYHVEQDSCLVF